MRYYIFNGFLLACFLYLSACSLLGGSDEPATVTLSVSSSNQDAGAVTVTPVVEEYKSGDEITVQASPNNGFGFVEWTGDISTMENPLVFTIEQNTELVANFQGISSGYHVEMSISDTAGNTQDNLRFGQISGATDEVDPIDYPAPPPPPQEVLHAHFQNAEDLFYDYRNPSTSSLTWNLQLQPGETDSLFISWDLQETVLNGSLIMRNEDSSIELDMTTESELQIEVTEADHLLIEYTLGGS